MCGASACCCRQLLTMRNFNPGSGRFCRGSRNRAGSTGRNIRIETRWTKFDADDISQIRGRIGGTRTGRHRGNRQLNRGTLVTPDPHGADRVSGRIDPVAFGLVESLARPGGNATGFMSFEVGTSSKWVELLKEIAPGVKRAAVLRTLAYATGPGQFGAMQAVAPSLGVELRPIDTHDAEQIERAVVAFASEPNGGLIAATGGGVLKHRELIVALAARHRLPTIYAYRSHVVSGGLMSYGKTIVDQYRRAAGYVDRILKGEKPADLPVQVADQIRAGDQPQDRKGARP